MSRAHHRPARLRRSLPVLALAVLAAGPLTVLLTDPAPAAVTDRSGTSLPSPAIAASDPAEPTTTVAPTTTEAPAPREAAPSTTAVTTTTAPPPPTTAPPTTAAPTTTAPAVTSPGPSSAEQTSTASEQESTSGGNESREERLHRAYRAGVPERWRADIDVQLRIIPGRTSWAHGDGRIEIGESHANDPFDHLTDVIAHEFGHLIAFEYGTGEYPGAAPEGWPAPSERPEEAWADCVQTAFTGRVNPSHGLGPCGSEQLDWAGRWLAEHPRDG